MDGRMDTKKPAAHESPTMLPVIRLFFHGILFTPSEFERKMKTRVVTNQGAKLIITAIMTPNASPSPAASRLEIWPWASCATLNKRIKYPAPSGKLNEVCDQTVNVLKEEGCRP